MQYQGHQTARCSSYNQEGEQRNGTPCDALARLCAAAGREMAVVASRLCPTTLGIHFQQ